MGQAKIRRERQRAEAEKRKADAPIRPAVLKPPPTEAIITINTDGISDQQKATEKFKSAYRDMLAQLKAPGFIPVLCAHEAAHAIYFTLAGMKEFDPQPSKIEYDPAIDDYKGSLAAIKILDLPTWKEGEFWDWFFKIARAHAAGGVVARKLMPSSDGGDSDDKDRFEKLCKEINNKDKNVNINFEDIWKQAQGSIAENLENSEVMALIQKEALALRPQFGF